LKRPRVLFLVENAPVPDDRRVWNEARTLVDAGYRVSIICPTSSWARSTERVEGISIYRFPLPFLGGMGGHLIEYGLALPIMFALTWVVFIREGFDVIHAANPPDFLHWIGRVFKPFGKKFIFDQHDVVPEACAARWSGLKLRIALAIARWGERASLRSADVVITPNQSVRRIAIERGGINPDRVFVVRNAIRRTDFRDARPRPELRRGKRWLVCYAGVIGPNDGLERLVQAAQHVAVDRGRRDVHFVVIGDGDNHRRILQMSQRLGLNDIIEFPGWIRDDRLIADYLASADVCVAPDPKNPLNDLCSMNKIVEYMAMGKPVVAFDLDEARETAREAGAFVAAHGSDATDGAALGDAILELLNSPERRQRMGEAGQRRFHEVLAWEHQRDTLLRAYESLAGCLVPASLPAHRG
jgi:glycosyltransferase involved in cell wall biosynthesis